MAGISSDAIPRRALLKAGAAAPLAALLAPGEARGAEYGSPAEVFAAVDAAEGDVAARLRGLAELLPSCRPFTSSVLADHGEHRAARARLRRRLGLPPGAPPRLEVSSDRDLAALRAAQEALVYAHAEGMPALDDSVAVDTLARHMVVLARHLTVIDLWIEAEADRV